MHGQQSTGFAKGDASAELNQCSSKIPTSNEGFTCFTRFYRFGMCQIFPKPSTKSFCATHSPQFWLTWALFCPLSVKWNRYYSNYLISQPNNKWAVIAVTFSFSNDWWKVICSPLHVMHAHSCIYSAWLESHALITCMTESCTMYMPYSTDLICVQQVHCDSKSMPYYETSMRQRHTAGMPRLSRLLQMWKACFENSLQECHSWALRVMVPATMQRKMLQSRLLVKALVIALLALGTGSANLSVGHSSDCLACVTSGSRLKLQWS